MVTQTKYQTQTQQTWSHRLHTHNVTTLNLLRNLAEDLSLDSILTGGRFLLLKASSCASISEQSMEALVA